VNPWETPLDVYNDKVNPPSEDKVILAMRIDTELEDFVARLFTEETDKEVQRYNKTIIQQMSI
jgi:predicted phage-related endonuclease